MYWAETEIDWIWDNGKVLTFLMSSATIPIPIPNDWVSYRPLFHLTDTTFKKILLHSTQTLIFHHRVKILSQNCLKENYKYPLSIRIRGNYVSDALFTSSCREVKASWGRLTWTLRRWGLPGLCPALRPAPGRPLPTPTHSGKPCNINKRRHLQSFLSCKSIPEPII